MNMKLLKILVLFLSASALLSCSDKDSNAVRPDTMELWPSAECDGEAPLDKFCLGVKAGVQDFYVRTGVSDFKAFWQDAAPLPWAEVTSCEQVSGDVWKVSLAYDDRAAYPLYTRRVGTLSVVKPESALGVFLPVYQGAYERTGSRFDELVYGSEDPYVTAGETEISTWTTQLKNLGFTSAPVAPDTLSRCYGKNGMVKLGDEEGHRGCICTPYDEGFRSDSLLMVCFDALAWKSEDGSVKDQGKFVVDVLDGGVIRDLAAEGGTSLVLDAPYLGESGHFMVFIAATETNPLTTRTRIRITSGTPDGTGNARLYVDNISVVRIIDGFDEDFFIANGGSGRDKNYSDK